MNVFGVLAVYFLNYGILYLICPSANYHQTISGVNVQGVFYDYNAFWFNDIGYQVSFSMVIEAIFPLVELALYFSIKWIR